MKSAMEIKIKQTGTKAGMVLAHLQNRKEAIMTGTMLKGSWVATLLQVFIYKKISYNVKSITRVTLAL